MLETDWTLLRLFDPNEAAEHLEKALNLAVNEVFPEKQSKIDMRKNKPWFNFKLKKMKDEKTKEYLKNGHSVEFIALEAKYDRSLKEAKREFKEEKITQALKAKNYKEMFKNIKHLAGIQTKESNFVLPGDEGKPAKEVAEKLCQFFSKISQEYPPIDTDSLPDRVKARLTEAPNPPQISQEDVLKIMQKMKKSTSMVEGDIPPKLKNEFIEHLSYPLTEMVNKCLSTCTFPDRYKMETCVVLPKHQPPQSLDQLRNLGLTQYCAKVLEGVVIHFLEPYIKDDPGQFGGKPGHSCAHYLIELIDFIFESFEEDNCATVAALADFSKGFNRVDHNRLVVTFSDMQIPVYLILMIISYLTKRKMRVRYNGVYSSEQDLPGGSPQGGLLSIVIFCIYTAGCGMKMSELIKQSTPEEYVCMPKEQPMRNDRTIRLKYVDDTTLGAKVALSELLRLKEETIIPPYLFEEKRKRELTAWEMSDNKNELHEMIEDMENFVRLSKMKLNTDKTKVMFFNNKTGKDGIASYQCEGTLLEQVETFKVLGFQLQANMRVTEHVQKMLTKATSKVWALKVVMDNGGGIAIGKQFYITWVASLLEGLVPVWHGRLTKRESESIENVQRKCFRIILRGGYTNYEEACATLEMKTLHDRREDLCYKFVAKAMKQHPHLYPKDVNAKMTRQGGKNHLEIPKYTTTYRKKVGKCPWD